MTISRVGTATGITTATVPAHQVGDLIIIAAFRNTTGTPALGTGFQSILTKTGTTSSMRVGFKIATSTSDTSGTWTNATALVCHVYRSSGYGTGSSLYIGGSASSSSTTNTVNYPALTMTHTDNTSWALGFAGVSNLTETISTAPSGMTNQSLETAAATQCAGHDTNGTVSSWSSTNATTTGTAGNSVSATVELIENQAGSAITNCVQHIVSSTVCTAAEGTTFDFYQETINPTLSGNALLLVVSYPSGNTPAITDDKSNSWPASGAVGSTVTADAGAGNMAMQAFILTSATTGTSKITIGFGGHPISPVTWWITELEGVTATLSAHSSATAVNTGGIVSPGSLTPGSNNCLVLAYMGDSNTVGTTTPAMIVPETGYQLNDADISVKTSGWPKASQYALQTTATATTPRFYLNAGGAETYNVLALALTTGSQGTLPSTGAGNSPWISKRIHFSQTAVGGVTAWLLQTPSIGNCMLLTSHMASTGTPNWNSGVSSSDSGAWTFENPVAGASSAYILTNQTANSARNTTITVSAANVNIQVIYYDISNCATSPVVTTAAVAGTAEDSKTTTGNQPSITPSGTNQLTVAYMQMGTGPSYSVVTPSGGVFNLPYAYQWQGTGNIAGTSWTQSTTTWGSNPVTGSAGGLSQAINDTTTPGNLTTGCTISGNASPFTLSNAGTTVTGDTFRLGFDDGNMLAWGNAAGHFYNGASTATQNWTWGISNILAAIGNSCSGFAIIFKGPPAAATTSFAWNPRTQDDRLLPVSRLPDQGQPWFRPSQSPPPTTFLPTTGQEDRPPPPSRRPDDSSIENRRWFTRSPSPVPTSWLPTTGQEDRPPNPNRIPAPDQPFSWFVRSPDVVPTTYLPTTGEEDRPPPIKRPPDEPTGFFFKPVAVQTTPTTLLPTTGQEDRPPNPNRVPAPDQPFPWFRASVIPLPTFVLPATGAEDRPPPPSRRPDNSSLENRQWFVQSPLPVPMRWVPTAGQEDRPLSPSRTLVPDQPFPWFFTQSSIAVVWLPTAGHEDKPPNPNRVAAPDQPFPWFLQSPSPVPTSWLPTAGEQNYPPPIKRPPDESVPFFFKFVPPVAVAGIAWWRQTEVYLEPAPAYRDYKPSWAPQFIVQIVPQFTEVYSNDFINSVGRLGTIERNP